MPVGAKYTARLRKSTSQKLATSQIALLPSMLQHVSEKRCAAGCSWLKIDAGCAACLTMLTSFCVLGVLAEGSLCANRSMPGPIPDRENHSQAPLLSLASLCTAVRG